MMNARILFVLTALSVLHSATAQEISHCGETYYASTEPATITSPNYPDYYPTDIDECITTIRADAGYNVELDFQSFDIEYSSDDCGWDYLEVRDGDSSGSPLLGKFCGSSIPGNIYSSGSSLWIKFHSDWQVTTLGFLLYFRMVDITDVSCNKPVISNGTVRPSDVSVPLMGTYEVSCDQGFLIPSGVSSIITCHVGESDGTSPYPGAFDRDVVDICEHTAPHCGAVYHATTEPANITSPRHPDSYPVSITCNTTIYADPGKVIELDFAWLDMESHSTCNYDFVQVRDGDSSESPLLKKFCGGSTWEFYSSGNAMWMEFHSDYSNTGDGFVAYFRQLDTVCGEDYYTAELVPQNITSPFYPDNYSNNTFCNWTISARAGHKILLTFIAFEVEYYDAQTTTCGYDYVRVTNSSGDYNTYCGWDEFGKDDMYPNDPKIISMDNMMEIDFRSDQRTALNGFIASYQLYACPLAEVVHGRWQPQEMVPVGEFATLTCDEGSVMEGTARIECLDSLTLSDAAPTCVHQGCTRPTVENGNVSPNDATIALGDSYQISCDNGYSVTGDDEMECQSDGSLSNSGTYCALDSATCTRPNIENGEVSPNDASIDEGDSYRIWCDDGYSVTGDNDMECQSDGTLSNDGTSYCIPDTREGCDWDDAWGAYRCYVSGATTGTATMTLLTTVIAALLC